MANEFCFINNTSYEVLTCTAVGGETKTVGSISPQNILSVCG